MTIVLTYSVLKMTNVMIMFMLFVYLSFALEVYGKRYNLPEPIDLSHTFDEKTIYTFLGYESSRQKYFKYFILLGE